MLGGRTTLKGQALVCFVTLKNGRGAISGIAQGGDPSQQVAKEIEAPSPAPDDVRFAAGLPKTRSGKIMRRILKEIAGGGTVKGDTTTSEDFLGRRHAPGGGVGRAAPGSHSSFDPLGAEIAPAVSTRRYMSAGARPAVARKPRCCFHAR